jgi:hypothetical protein
VLILPRAFACVTKANMYFVWYIVWCCNGLCVAIVVRRQVLLVQVVQVVLIRTGKGHGGSFSGVFLDRSEVYR